jgi:hypothetical protein
LSFLVPLSIILFRSPPEFEYPTEDGLAPAEEDEDGKETGQRQTPHDALRPGFGFPVSGIVLRVNADALT